MGDWISRMIAGMMAQREANERLKRLEEECGPARLKGETHCLRCGFCCYARPGVPAPEQMQAIADRLEMDLKECIGKFFTIDRMEGVYYLKPAGVNTMEYAGEFLPSHATFNEGKCVFLTGGFCQIYEVRPVECRESYCWIENDAEKQARDSWKPDKLKSLFGIDGEALEEATSNW